MKHCQKKKKSDRVDRENNAALFMLRCVQLGLSISDLDYLSIGMVNDMFIEKQNDEYEYDIIATREHILSL